MCMLSLEPARCHASSPLCLPHPPQTPKSQTKTEADQAEIKRLYGQFGKWHGISSINNLAVLVATFAYGWSLAGKLAL